MGVSHAILFLENADFVRITGLYFPAKFELTPYINFTAVVWQPFLYGISVPKQKKGKPRLRSFPVICEVSVQ